jgi:hypothetical protein
MCSADLVFTVVKFKSWHKLNVTWGRFFQSMSRKQENLQYHPIIHVCVQKIHFFVFETAPKLHFLCGDT